MTYLVYVGVQILLSWPRQNTQHPQLKEEKFIWFTVVEVSVHSRLAPRQDDTEGALQRESEQQRTKKPQTVSAAFFPVLGTTDYRLSLVDGQAHLVMPFEPD